MKWVAERPTDRHHQPGHRPASADPAVGVVPRREEASGDGTLHLDAVLLQVRLDIVHGELRHRGGPVGCAAWPDQHPSSGMRMI